MVSNTMKRSGMTGYIVRDNHNPLPLRDPGNTSVHLSQIRMPDGKLVKVIDRALFDKAVSAAMSRKK